MSQSQPFTEDAAMMLELADKIKYARERKLIHGTDVSLTYQEMDLAQAALRTSAVQGEPVAWREASAAALARRLCQLFDSGGESQRSARARHASAIFQLLNRDTPAFHSEQSRCDANPVEYLETAERVALAHPAIGTPDSPADEIIDQIEERFPDWRGFRDLVDCIDVTLHHLRGGS